MRLGIIRQHYAPYAPAEGFFEKALEALLERSVGIALYTRAWPDTRLQLIEPVICNPPYLGRLSRDWGFARAACRAVSAGMCDLVQSQELLSCCDVYRPANGLHVERLLQLERAAGPVTRVVRRLAAYDYYLLATERALFRSPWLRTVICNSRMVREEIRQHFGLPEDRLPVLHNAVDSDAFHPGLRSLRGWLRERHRISDAAVVFLLAASGYAVNGVPAAVEALARLPPSAHLLVLGEDRRAARYARLARELGLAERVTFVGPQAEPKPYLGAADVFVLPTLYDACANAALEAMACGLPVVTSTKCGAAEIALEHDAGFACDALDIDGLAAHMRTLLDSERRAAMGANARRAVMPLNTAALTLKLVLLYRDLLGEAALQVSAAQGQTTSRPALAAASTLGSGPRADAGLATPEIMTAPAFGDAAGEIPHDSREPPPVLESAVDLADTPPELSIDAGPDLRAGSDPAQTAERARRRD